MPELFFVGRNATIMNAHPKNVNEYSKQNMKNSIKLTFLKMNPTAKLETITELNSEMARWTKNHEAK